MTEAEVRKAEFDARNERDWNAFMAIRNMTRNRRHKHSFSFTVWMGQVNSSLAAKNGGTYKDYPYKAYRKDYRNGISANSLALHLMNKR